MALVGVVVVAAVTVAVTGVAVPGEAPILGRGAWQQLGALPVYSDFHSILRTRCWACPPHTSGGADT